MSFDSQGYLLYLGSTAQITNYNWMDVLFSINSLRQVDQIFVEVLYYTIYTVYSTLYCVRIHKTLLRCFGM